MSFCKKMVGFVCLAAALVGCSLASIGGRYADWYVMRRIDTYVKLTPEQDAYLDPRIDEHLVWIKSDLLPDAHKSIGELIVRIERGITDDDITWSEGRIDFLRSRLQQRIMVDTMWLLSRLSPEQIKHLEKELNASIEKRSEKAESQTADEFKKEKLEQYEETFKDWVGSVTDAQKALLHELYGDLATIEQRKIYLSGRAEVQANFLKLTSSPVNEIALREFITTWIENPAELRTGISKERYLKRTAIFRASLLRLQETLSVDQRKELINTLKDHQRDILAFSQSKA